MNAVDLRLAAGRNQIGIVFSPLVSRRTRAVAGFVAHACWDHPDAGRVAPERLRPLAERHGLDRRLDAWTAERVGALLAMWDAEALDALALLAVVVGPETLADPGAHRYLRAVADLAGLPPTHLRLVAEVADLTPALARRGLETTALGSVSADAAAALLGGVRPVTVTRRVRTFVRVRRAA